MCVHVCVGGGRGHVRVCGFIQNIDHGGNFCNTGVNQFLSFAAFSTCVFCRESFFLISLDVTSE